MKTLKILLLLCSLILTLNADNDKHENRKNHIYKNLDYLDLNKKQYKQFKKILITYKHNHKDFYEYKEEQEEKLQKLMRNKTFDKKEYIRIIKEIQEKAVQLEAQELEKIHTILNKKQRKKFSYYLQEWEVE